jgi:uncharacterized membrane protein
MTPGSSPLAGSEIGQDPAVCAGRVRQMSGQGGHAKGRAALRGEVCGIHWTVQVGDYTRTSNRSSWRLPRRSRWMMVDGLLAMSQLDFGRRSFFFSKLVTDTYAIFGGLLGLFICLFVYLLICLLIYLVIAFACSNKFKKQRSTRTRSTKQLVSKNGPKQEPFVRSPWTKASNSNTQISYGQRKHVRGVIWPGSMLTLLDVLLLEPLNFSYGTPNLY